MAKRWYVVHTYSGYENRVKADLEHRIESYGLTSQVVDVKVPMEKVTEIKDKGKKVTKEQTIYPGYVLVRMELNDNTWSVVRNTPGVTGFVGMEGKPSPLSREEFAKIMGKTTHEKSTETHRTTTTFKVGQSIHVVSGPFDDFDGVISEINAEAGKAKVTLLIFGRETPVELSINQIASI